MISDDGVDAKNGDETGHPPEKANGSFVPAQPYDDHNRKTRANGEQPPSRRFWTIVREVFEIVSLIAVIATMAFVGLQWREMARQYGVMAAQLKEMHTTGVDTHTLAEQTKVLAESTRISADAAKISAENSNRIARGSETAVKIAHTSIRLDQRARIGIRAEDGFHFASDTPPKVKVLFVNSGKTPALNVRTHAEFQFVSMGVAQPPADTGATPEYEALKSVTVLHAAQVSFVPLQGKVADPAAMEEVFRLVKDGKMTLYLRVVITYDDVFAPRHSGIGLHRVESCDVYIPALDGLYGCGFGNYTD